MRPLQFEIIQNVAETTALYLSYKTSEISSVVVLRMGLGIWVIYFINP